MSAQARYLRIDIYEVYPNNTDGMSTISELEIISNNVNVASSGITTASSEYSVRTPELAIDNDFRRSCAVLASLVLRFSFLVFAEMTPHYRKNKRIENGAALMEQMPSLQLAVRLGFACQA